MKLKYLLLPFIDFMIIVTTFWEELECNYYRTLCICMRTTSKYRNIDNLSQIYEYQMRNWQIESGTSVLLGVKRLRNN